MAQAALDVVLGHGVVDTGGTRHRRARLRPVTGEQEELFAGSAELPAPERVDALLAGALARLGGYDAERGEVTPSLVSGLTRGDRGRLLLALRASLVGDEIRLILSCPDPLCRELSEIVMSAGDLLLPHPAGAVVDDAVVSTPDGPLRVRPVRGYDDAAVRDADLGEAGDADATRASADLLWSRLVTGPGGVPVPASGVGRWRLRTRAALAAALAGLAERAGAPDLALVARCPACGYWMELEPNPVDLLARAARDGTERLWAEVHCLAYHYGWGEDAILRLPRLRRRRYLDLLRRQLDGRPLVDLRR